MTIFDKERFKSYFKQGSTEDEEFIATSFLNEKNHADLRTIAEDQWNNSSSQKVELQHVLNALHFHINSSTPQKNLVKQIITLYGRIAAILALPLMIATIYLLSQQFKAETQFAEIAAPKGSRVQFTLPDGTKGFLNGGSKLKYPTVFGDNRVVDLSGEGFFEVAKDARHPFLVKTKHHNVKVLGTKFDVCAYEDEATVLTTLEEGSVQILSQTGNPLTILTPGQQNVLETSTGKFQNKYVKPKLYTSWKDETLRFDNATFDEVVKKMERWYGVSIVLDSSLRFSENYTFTIKTESLRELLELLSLTTPINYKIEIDTVKVFPSKPASQQVRR